jgi:hypothetical protein
MNNHVLFSKYEKDFCIYDTSVGLHFIYLLI